MLDKPLRRLGPITMPFLLGDTVDSNDLAIQSVDNNANVTLTGQQVASADLDMTNGTNQTNTLPTAEQLCAALRGGQGINVPPADQAYGPDVAPEMEFPSNMGIIPPESTFRRVFRNTNSGTVTLAAPATSGVSISGTATMATNKWREYVVRIKASAPTAVVSATTTNNNKNLTNISTENIRKIQPGMSVYGTGIGASAVVDSVNHDTKTVHVTVNSTATADNIAVTFTPTVTYTNLRAGDV